MNIYINTVIVPQVVRSFQLYGHIPMEGFQRVLVPAEGVSRFHTGNAFFILGNEGLDLPPSGALHIRSDWSCVRWSAGAYALLGANRHIVVFGDVECWQEAGALPLVLDFFTLTPQQKGA